MAALVLSCERFCQTCFCGRFKYLANNMNVNRWKQLKYISLKLNRQFHRSCVYSNDMPRVKVDLDKRIEKDVLERKYKYTKHPGVTKLPLSEVPEFIQNGMQILLEGSSKKEILENSKSLINFYRERKCPVESKQIKDKFAEVKGRFEQEIVEMAALPDDEIEKKKEIIESKIKSIMKVEIYHWKSIDYDKMIGLAYMLSRFSPDFAVLNRVFNEIKLKEPNFKPEHLFDFGSGVGTVFWATNHMWPDTIKEYFAVDSSSDMIEIATSLIENCQTDSSKVIQGIHHRQYLPAIPKPYDLVVSAFSLMELPSFKSRLQTLDVLWRKTTDFLVLIELGTNAGYEAIEEARDFLLKTSDEPIHVFAPCPHDLVCPRFVDLTNKPCNFEVAYNSLSFLHPRECTKTQFSYVILRKGPRPEVADNWPRLVQEVLKKHNHIVCRMCCPNGKLQEAVITKSKHSEILYKCAKKIKWGDRIPIEILNSESETEVTREDDENKMAEKT